MGPHPRREPGDRPSAPAAHMSLALARLPGKLGKLLCSPNLDMRHRYAQVSFLALGSALTPDSARGALCGAGEEARSTTRTVCAFSAVRSLCPHTIPWDEPNVGTRIRNPNCPQRLLQNFPPHLTLFFHRVLVTGGQLGDGARERRAGRSHLGIHRPTVLPVAPNTPSKKASKQWTGAITQQGGCCPCMQQTGFDPRHPAGSPQPARGIPECRDRSNP